MNKLFAKLFKRKDKKAKSIDLSAASDTGLTLILLRVPVEYLIKNCTQVSPQWNRILSESSFWRDKMDYDGYHLEWRKFKLTGISVDSFKSMALDHYFNRNFIMDRWDLDARNLTLDSGWDRMIDHKWEQLTAENVRTEIPPVFVDGEPEIPPGFERPIPACIGIHEISFAKGIQIRLAFEGLTDEIMDKFRPTIVVSEMVGNRRDCYYTYGMICALEAPALMGKITIALFEAIFHLINENNEMKKGMRMAVGLAQQSDFDSMNGMVAERWHPVEHVFKDYPAGMRYLRLSCYAVGREGNPADQCGLKLANCSVKALFEKNAPE